MRSSAHRFTSRASSLLPLSGPALAIWVTLGVTIGPALADRGAWTPMNQLQELGGEAIHLSLIPGDGVVHHSRVLWWQNRATGAVLGWNPGNDGCDNYPSASFQSIGTWNALADIFCSGATLLADSKFMTFGGNESPLLWGTADARTYSFSGGADPGSWTARPGMTDHRWYATATLLRDNRVFVNSGKQYMHLWLWGGRRDGAPPAGGTGDLLHRFAPFLSGGVNGRWDASITPDADATNGSPNPREGHTAAYFQEQVAEAIFGGKEASGVLSDPDVWLLQRNNGSDLAGEYPYSWTRLVLGNPTIHPQARTQHTAIEITGTGSTAPTEMVVLGGLGGGNSVLSDFWHLRKNNLGQWVWTQVQVNGGSPPTARYGHAIAYDQGSRRLFVFGGSEAFGQPASDSRVWVFTLNHAPTAPASGSWSELAIDGNSRRPEPRRDHTMVLDPEGVNRPGFSGELVT